MKDFAKKYLDWYKGLDKIVKVLFCLLWDIPANLARFTKSVEKDNMLGIILSIVLAIFGGWLLFVVDIITLIVKDKLFWLDEI